MKALFKFFAVCALWLMAVTMAYCQLPPGVNPIDPSGIGNLITNPFPVVEPTPPVSEKIDQTNPEVKLTELEEKEQKEKEKEILALKRQGELPQAKIWGQQFFRDQSISLFTRARDIKALESYILGVGDELTIAIWGNTDYSANVIIEQDGYIDLSGATLKIPRLYIKGLTFSNAKKAIIERMRHHVDINGSQSAIELNFKRNLTVNIVGEIFNPGSYTMPAVNTAFNALVAAGGPSQIGSVRKIKVESAGKETRILDVYKFVSNPNVADAFFLDNNDYIFVPLAGRVIDIQGSIKRPFSYELIEGENLIQLLYYAGGLQADAYQTNIQIIRYEANEERLIDLNLGEMIKQSVDFPLLNGDRIMVSPIKQAYSNYVSVVGAVKLPGQYQLDKETKVRDVLLKAGVIYSAVMERVYIKRLREDLSIEYIDVSVYELLENPDSDENITLRPLDEIEVKYKADFIDKYNISAMGAIRKPGKYEYSKNLSLADLIYMANGIRNEAAGSYIEISRLKREGMGSDVELMTYAIDDSLKVANADNIFLEPYDHIFVRLAKEFELPKNVVLNGEVRFPGVYTIEKKNERITDLIRRAGGLTTVAFLEGSKLQRVEDGYILLDLRELESEDSLVAANSKFNYILKEGDIITIPKIKDLVSIAGRVRHPHIKETIDIKELEREKELIDVKSENEKKKKEIDYIIAEKRNPVKINVPFHENKNAMFYLKEYGAGIDREAGGRKKLIFVRYSNGLIKKTRNYFFFQKHPKVEKGAMVYVGTVAKKLKRERQKVNPATISSVIVSQLTAGLTLVLLVDRIFTP